MRAAARRGCMVGDRNDERKQMQYLGERIAARRRELGLTQSEFAEQLYVTRQTVSRWEQGAATPDVETLVRIGAVLEVSCDYLLREEIDDTAEPATLVGGKPISRLLLAARGRQAKLTFFENEWDPDLLNRPCTILDFEGNWVRVSFRRSKKAETTEKLLPLSSVFSVELLDTAKEA